MARRSGISPVIATVIIVAVTIAVAIAVAFWMTGIIGLFTGFEQLQITSIYDDDDGIHLTVKNTGTQTATIIDIYINGRPCMLSERDSKCTIEVDDSTEEATIVLRPGDSKTITIKKIEIENLDKLGPGVSVEVKLLTASGKEYPKLIVLQEFPGSG